MKLLSRVRTPNESKNMFHAYRQICLSFSLVSESCRSYSPSISPILPSNIGTLVARPDHSSNKVASICTWTVKTGSHIPEALSQRSTEHNENYSQFRRTIRWFSQSSTVSYIVQHLQIIPSRIWLLAQCQYLPAQHTECPYIRLTSKHTVNQTFW